MPQVTTPSKSPAGAQLIIRLKPRCAGGRATMDGAPPAVWAWAWRKVTWSTPSPASGMAWPLGSPVSAGTN